MPPKQITRFTLRRAGHRDAYAIARAHVDSWQASYLGLIPAAVLNRLSVTGQAVSWRRILSTDDHRGARTWIITDGALVVGFCSAGPTRDEDDDLLTVGEIYTIYLIPPAWGRGLGAELLDAAQSDLAHRGHQAVSLWVLEGNTRARRFYELNGFAPDGGRRPVHVGEATLPEMRYRRML